MAFPKERFSDELLAELHAQAPEQIEISDRDGDGQMEVIISHLYIERRLVPLNLFLDGVLLAGQTPSRALRCHGEGDSSTAMLSGSGRHQYLSRRHAVEELLGVAAARWCSTTMTRSNI